MKCNICFHSEFKYLFSIKKRDKYEIEAGVKSKKYSRKILLCKICGSVNLVKKKSDLLRFNKIDNKYYSLTLKNQIKKKFDFVRLLPKKSSINFYRVNRITNLIKLNFKSNRLNTIDIGSGTGIFLYELSKKLKLKKIKSDNYALDSDPNSLSFLKKCDFIKKCFDNIEKINKKFDLITLNKTLEHVYDPLQFLKKLKKILKNDGLLYIEVPDNNNISQVNKDDPVFMSLHHNFYSSDTFNFLAKKLKLNLLYLKKINELNKKYTIYAVLSKKREYLNI